MLREKYNPAIIFVVSLLLFGGFVYLATLSNIGEKVVPQPIPPTSEETIFTAEQEITEFIISPPTSLITVDANQEIVIDNFEKDTILAALQALSDTISYPPESLTYLPVRMAQLSADGQPRYLSIFGFFTILEIEMPQGLAASVEPDLMLYLYTPGEEERQICENNNFETSDGTTRPFHDSCFGPRLGIIMRAQEGQQEGLTNFAVRWAELLVDRYRANQKPTLGVLLLSRDRLVQDPFQSTTYTNITKTLAEVPVQYINLPISPIALNFAVARDMLLIGTSKNSLFSLLDKITQENF